MNQNGCFTHDLAKGNPYKDSNSGAKNKRKRSENLQKIQSTLHYVISVFNAIIIRNIEITGIWAIF